MADLLDTLTALGQDRTVRVVVLTGEGRGFCSGNDIRGDGDGLPDRPASWDRGPVATFDVQSLYSEVTLRMRSLPQPLIAAVNGPATGGGFTLALACDLRYSARSAVFAASFARVGLSGCDMGTSWLLTRLVGRGHASDLLLTGRIIDSTYAKEIGIVLDVVDDGKVVDRAVEAARAIVGTSSVRSQDDQAGLVVDPRDTVPQRVDRPGEPNTGIGISDRGFPRGEQVFPRKR